MSFNLIEFLIVSGSIQGIFFTLFLLIRSKKQFLAQNVFLSLYILFFSLIVIKGWYIGSGYYQKKPSFLFLPFYFSWALGPLFYFYISYLFVKDYTFRTKQWLHLGAPFIQFLYYLIIFTWPVDKRITHFENDYLLFFLLIEDTIGIISLAVYLFLSLKLVKVYQKSVYNNFTDVSKVHLKWVNHFIFASFCFLLMWIALFLIDFWVYDYQQSYSFYYPSYLLIVAISYWIMYEGFFHPVKIQPDFVINNGSTSYSLPQQEIDDLLKRLACVMETDELYLRPKLSLQELAQNIGTNPKYLSQIINSHLNKSFYDYVNEYRVNKAKKELLSPENFNLTISAISSLCGFNSKSTFNEVFKKYTRQTPSAFIKNNA